MISVLVINLHLAYDLKLVNAGESDLNRYSALPKAFGIGYISAFILHALARIRRKSEPSGYAQSASLEDTCGGGSVL